MVIYVLVFLSSLFVTLLPMSPWRVFILGLPHWLRNEPCFEKQSSKPKRQALRKCRGWQQKALKCGQNPTQYVETIFSQPVLGHTILEYDE